MKERRIQKMKRKSIDHRLKKFNRKNSSSSFSFKPIQLGKIGSNMHLRIQHTSLCVSLQIFSIFFIVFTEISLPLVHLLSLFAFLLFFLIDQINGYQTH